MAAIRPKPSHLAAVDDHPIPSPEQNDQRLHGVPGDLMKLVAEMKKMQIAADYIVHPERFDADASRYLQMNSNDPEALALQTKLLQAMCSIHDINASSIEGQAPKKIPIDPALQRQFDLLAVSYLRARDKEFDDFLSVTYGSVEAAQHYHELTAFVRQHPKLKYQLPEDPEFDYVDLAPSAIAEMIEHARGFPINWEEK